MRKFKNDDIFLIEKYRDKYAREGSLKQFCKLYSNKIVGIPNRNTGRLWDKLNEKTKTDLERSPIYENKINIVTKLLYQKQGNLLDIGFGNGFVEKKLCKVDLKLFGIDISKKSTSNLDKEIKGVFKIGTVLRIPFRSNYFDFVLLLDVLEHISANKTFRALSEVNRVLKMGGYLIISVPLNEGLRRLVESGNNPSMHVRQYTREILKFELNLFNFDIRKEYLLYAFDRHYWVKTLFTKIFLRAFRNPNLYIVFAQKR